MLVVALTRPRRFLALRDLFIGLVFVDLGPGGGKRNESLARRRHTAGLALVTRVRSRDRVAGVYPRVLFSTPLIFFFVSTDTKYCGGMEGRCDDAIGVCRRILYTSVSLSLPSAV